MEQGVVQIYYGEGHGKTTAAFGSAIRTAVYGGEAIIIQFLKGKNPTAEHFFNRLEPEIKCFNFAKSEECFASLDEEKKQEETMNLRNGFNYSKKVISTGACDLVVLDEILGLVDQGVITEEEIKELLESKPEHMSIICTGRVLSDSLRACADQIYNVAPEK